MIDADPQCNMTEIMLSPIIQELDQEMETTGIDQILPGTSLLELLKPRIEGAVPNIDISNVKVIHIKDNLDLIRGDVNLSSIEDSLAEAHSQRFSTKTHEKRTFVAMGDFVTRFGESGKYDYILFDVGPSSGAITRSCFLACDAFIIPTSPDRFNIQAISTLASILDRWFLEYEQVYDSFKSIGLPIKHGKPQFLGVTIQHYKLLNGRPKPGFRLWMDRIPNAVEEQLFPVLKKYSTDQRDLTCGLDSGDITITNIPDFGSLAPLMQECGKAVFNISRSETAVISDSGKPWGGATWTDAERRMSEYKQRFVEIKTRLEQADEYH